MEEAITFWERYCKRGRGELGPPHITLPFCKRVPHSGPVGGAYEKKAKDSNLQ